LKTLKNLSKYVTDNSDGKIRQPMVALDILYEEMPETTGCENCEQHNPGDEKHYCCKLNTPSMYYVEFLKIWKSIQNSWSKKKKIELILRAMKNSMEEKLFKLCCFYDDGCTVYKERAFVCRLYSIMDDDSWDSKVKIFKESYGEEQEIRPQCNLVTAEGGKPSFEQENKWFEFINKQELRIGVPKEVVNNHDGPIGSYRAAHDHLLMELFDMDFLTQLSQIRQSNPSEENIDKLIEILKSQVEEAV